MGNIVEIVGSIVGITKDHNYKGRDYTRLTVESVRRSGIPDYIPVLLASDRADLHEIREGDKFYICGEMKSYNENRKLVLYVAPGIIKGTEAEDMNEIYINGFLCKDPVHRYTPFGREITDLLIASNDSGRSEYIPVVAWERTAMEASRLPVGSYVSISGRIQSRIYMKDGCERTAYEVSASTIEKITI